MTNIERGRRGHLSLVPEYPDSQVEHRLPVLRERRPRRLDTVRYTLRIGLEDVEPEVWRRIEVPSDIMLDALHPVLQAVMGWTDSHLHSFVSASAKYSDDALRFDMRPRFDEEEDFGEHREFAYEDTARLDELLADIGDLLFYQYDFGDGWEHVIVLEKVGELVDGPSPVCIDGAQACPPEDCGGAYGYARLLEALANPTHPEHRELRAWAGPDMDPERFSVEDVNAELMRQATLRASYPAPGTRAAGLLRLIPEPAAPLLYSLLPGADFRDESAHGMSDEEAELVTKNLRWLLSHIGEDGVALTQAGYLRPVDVVIAREALGWAGHSQRVSNRETDCQEMLDLRGAAADLGLTRKLKGKLLRTKRGAVLLADPGALLTHIVEQLPIGAAELERDSGLLMLLAIACGTPDERRSAVVAEALTAMGWRTDGQPIDWRYTPEMAGPTLQLWRAIGAFGPREMRLSLGPDDAPRGPSWSRKLARMALLHPGPAGEG